MKTGKMQFAKIFTAGVIFLLLFYSARLSAQSVSKPSSAVVVSEIVENRVHYILDLTVLPSFLEKALLLEHIFADSKLLIEKTDISGKTLDLYSDSENKQEEIILVLNDYINLVIEEGKKLNSEQREQLSQKYNKYR